jgi:hypothetical protein
LRNAAAPTDQDSAVRVTRKWDERGEGVIDGTVHALRHSVRLAMANAHQSRPRFISITALQALRDRKSALHLRTVCLLFSANEGGSSRLRQQVIKFPRSYWSLTNQSGKGMKLPFFAHSLGAVANFGNEISCGCPQPSGFLGRSSSSAERKALARANQGQPRPV